jgi:ribosomal protein S18 acetylase RimI-like enzyme
MGPAVALRCAREPRVAIQILRRLIDGGTPVSSPDAAALLSLAVSRTAQSGGLGTLLTNAFIDDARSRGGRAIVLTTDADDNESTIACYERLGFVRTATFESREGRRMHQYEFGIAG